jgi:hypothetical protein
MGVSAVSVDPAAQEPFSRRTVFWGIFASLLAAAGFFLLSTYAPDFRQPRDGGATPLSKSGIGYAGLAEWLKLTGEPPSMARSDSDLKTEMLLIVTVSPDSDPEALANIVKLRRGLDTLFVLPKWQTLPVWEHQGWEMKTERLPDAVVNDWLGRIAKAKLGEGGITVKQLDVSGQTVTVPDQLQWVADEHPLIAADNGKAVLTEVKDTPFYVLSDPDLINNAALKDPENAAAALDLIAAEPKGRYVRSTYGIGRIRSCQASGRAALPGADIVGAGGGAAFLHGLGGSDRRVRGPGDCLRQTALVDTAAML